MPTFDTLPAEIRQRIMRQAVLDVDRFTQSLIYACSQLMLVNRQSFQDMKEILHIWPQVYDIKKPHPQSWPTGPLQGQYCILPYPFTVRLNLFHLAKLDIIHRTSARWMGDHDNHFALLRDWRDRVPRILPKRVRTVIVDATPVPGYLRRKGDTYTCSVVNDARIRRIFLPLHQIHTVEILKNIFCFSGGKVDLVLAGRFGKGSYGWIKEVVVDCATAGVPLRLEAVFVQKQALPSESVSIEHDISGLSSDRRGPRSSREKRLQAFEAIRWVRWNRSTRNFYTTCHSHDETWTVQTLTQLAHFLSDKHTESLDLQAGNVVQRKLAHRMAKDVGLWTSTIGTEPNKFVRLSRSRRLPPPPL